jgi:uncharacterized OB-fold protein
MTPSAPDLEVVRCPSCHGTFSPPRTCCPRCGQRAVMAGRLPAQGIVIGATELSVPPAGWSAPHRLVLVELSEGMRVLATGPSPTPALGTLVHVVRSNAGYRIR